MSEVKTQLRQLGVSPSKMFGQNFVIDPGVIEAIVDFGRPTPDEKLVEIGGGLGALTAPLSRISPLTVIEVDMKMAAYLQVKFPNIKVLREDVRFVDFDTIGSALTVFGNLPYSFSSDIVFHLIKNRQHLKRAVLLLQSEFVDRMVAPHGSRTFGVLSIGVQLWCVARAGPVIKGDRFYPAADVDSKVVELQFRERPLVELEDEALFNRVVKSSFHQRRKKVFNSLRSSGIFDSETLTRAFTEAQIDPGLRAEALRIEDFARLANLLSSASRS